MSFVTKSSLFALRNTLSKYSKVLEDEDLEAAIQVINCISYTLEENKLRIEPDRDMLRASEAYAVACFLKSKYSGLYNLSVHSTKKIQSSLDQQIRSSAIISGNKFTESSVSSAIYVDEDFSEAKDTELQYLALTESFTNLMFTMKLRMEVLVEISRNERALLKTSD